MNDLKFALRQLRKSPGFTALGVITLALGIGVNSAIFSLINGVVLRSTIPLRPDEVVNVFTVRQNASHDYRQFSHTEYRELRQNSGDIFADVAALEFAVAGIGQDQNMRRDRKSTRLNSSHLGISYAVFCLKKKNKNTKDHT